MLASFQSSSRHTPEHRKESQRFREILDFEEEQAKNERDDLNPDKIGRERRPRRLFDDNGRPLNVNEAGIEFNYDDSDPGRPLVFFVLQTCSASIVGFNNTKRKFLGYVLWCPIKMRVFH